MGHGWQVSQRRKTGCDIGLREGGRVWGCSEGSAERSGHGAHARL